MVTYKVTTEFELSFEKLWFKEGDILDCGKSNNITTSVKIIGISRKKIKKQKIK